ncbi:MAG: efflux RND transporter permease subunit [Desulfovibrionaceae bacterium]|nr:efflux RND transporter permease subunit [Desulfovibrionaceae bacterium]
MNTGRRRIGPEHLPLNLAAPFIRRPVATMLITLAVTLAGIAAFALLPVAPLPQVDFPVIRVQGKMPGAGPETMAATVATPLERALGRISGITEMTSQSSLGSSSVVVQFDLDKNINGAAREVQAAINAALPSMPSMPSNPTYRKMNPAGMPIMILAITSDVLNPAQLYDSASTVLAQKISQLPGVGDVTVGGGALPAVRVRVNPGMLHHAGVSLAQVASALRAANAYGPLGMADSGGQQWLIGASTQLRTVEDYRQLIVARAKGAVLRLGDVADISIASQDERNLALADGRKAILLIVFRAPGANIIETVDGIHAMLPQLRAMLPEAAALHVSMDRSRTIRASLAEVEFSLLLSIALVTLVTLLFLRNGRATAIPAVAVPVSLIASFAVMYLCGYSLDNLSLMALTIATGFVVDDAIVVLENIMRYREQGFSPLRAAMLGAREVGFTVISITLSLVAVFIPILFMGGIVGRLFREFAVVLAAAVLISMVVSLTTTPMMCAHFLREASPAPDTRCRRIWNRLEECWHGMLRRMEGGYAASLRTALDHPRLTLLALLAVICLNVWLYVIVPKGFFPQQDTGQLMGGIRTDQSLSFQSLQEKFRRLMGKMLADPAVHHVSGHISGGRGGGGIFLELKPLRERRISADQVIARLRGTLNSEAGVQIFLQPAQDLHMGGRSARSQFQYTLQADNLADLRRWGARLERELSADALFRDVNSDMDERALQTCITFDRGRMAQLGVSMKDVDSALGNAFGQAQVSTIYDAQNQYRVVLELGDRWLEGAASLEAVHVPARDGLVPLTALGTVSTNFAARSVAHQGQFAAVTLSFNLRPGAAMSEAAGAVERARVRIGMPATITGSFQGTAKFFADTMKTQGLLILAALVTLYIVLGVLYESLIHPLTILSTLPSAGVGAILALLLCGKEFSVIALIGVLLLCGLVKKNAIMMIDFALDAARTRELPAKEAIFTACILRFRPIMMTTCAAILGAVPLALGTGDGAELRQPLGITIVGGLLVSQLLTLYTTPVVYLWLDRWRRKP